MALTRNAVRRAATGVVAAGLLSGVLQIIPSAALAAPVSTAKLNAATADLGVSARIPGTAWAVDPTSRRVIVSVDQTVTGAKLNQVRAVAARHGAAVQIQPISGTLRLFISGGSPIYAGGGGRCSLGFNVRSSSGTQYFVTAGHCTNISGSWYTSSGAYIGPRTGSSFPGNDYGIVRYDSSVQRSGTVFTQDIARAANPGVGQQACRRGSTTGTHCGRVTGLNATVNYAEGTVYGMIQTNICAEPGDSGGPLYYGSTAFGLTSGGSGNCRTGGTTFFQPVVEALNRYGVNVY